MQNLKNLPIGVQNNQKPKTIKLQANTYLTEILPQIMQLINSNQYKFVLIKAKTGQGKTTAISKMLQFIQNNIYLISPLTIAKEQSEETFKKQNIPFTTDLSRNQAHGIVSSTQHYFINNVDKINMRKNLLIDIVVFDEFQWNIKYAFANNHCLKLIQSINQIYGKIPIVAITATADIFQQYGQHLGVDLIIDVDFDKINIQPPIINLYSGNTNVEVKKLVLNQIKLSDKPVYVVVDAGYGSNEQKQTFPVSSSTIGHNCKMGNPLYKSAYTFMDTLKNECIKMGKKTIVVSNKTMEQTEVKIFVDKIIKEETLDNSYDVVIVSSKAESGFNIKNHSVENVIVLSFDVDFIYQAYSRFRKNCPKLTLFYYLNYCKKIPILTEVEILLSLLSAPLENNTYYPIPILNNLMKINNINNFISGIQFWQQLFPNTIINTEPEKPVLFPTLIKRFYNSGFNTDLAALYTHIQNFNYTAKQFENIISTYELYHYNWANYFKIREYYDNNKNIKNELISVFGVEPQKLSEETFAKLYYQILNIEKTPQKQLNQLWYHFD